MKKHKLTSPLGVYIPRKTKADKKFILNLNNYRNTHYISLNQAKCIYKNAMMKQITGLPKMEKINVIFNVYPKTRRLTDIGNVCSIHEKFFMDALVEFGRIPDDNYKYHAFTAYVFGSVDKKNPRVEIDIEEVI